MGGDIVKEIVGELLKIFLKLKLIDKNGYYKYGCVPRKLKHTTILLNIPSIDELVITEIHFEILSIFPDTDISYLDEAETFIDLINIINSSIER